MNGKQIQKLETRKDEIRVKGLNKISDYFDLDVKQLSGIKPEILQHIMHMARLGMQFEREMNVSQRATEMNFVRISKLVSENKREMRKYLKKTLPQYYR